MAILADAAFAVGVVVAVAALVQAAPRPAPEDDVQRPVGIIMVTQSPAEAIQDAIRYDPDVAAALQSNTTRLYLRKSVTYTSGTAEDLGLPKEEFFPGGAPDRVRIADKILYPSPIGSPTDTTQVLGSPALKPTAGIYATLQLVPVPIN